MPLVLFEGFSDEEIAKLETEDNENDEYHVKVSVVDVWAEYARLRDEEGWTQERIAKAKGISRPLVANRLRFNDQLPDTIKSNVSQEQLTEGHLKEFMTLFLEEHFTHWLTTSGLWIDLAELAIDKKLSVSQLKKEVDRWKKVIKKAGELHEKLDEVVEIGETMYYPRKLKDNPAFYERLSYGLISTPSGKQESTFLNSDLLHGWLCTVQADALLPFATQKKTFLPFNHGD